MLNQKARLYRVFTEKTKDKNSIGENLVVLRGSAYMLKEGNEDIINKAFEGGILKEVSVGKFCRKSVTCSICGEKIFYKLADGEIYLCENNHFKGDTPLRW